MSTDLPVSNPPTVDDALRALHHYVGDSPANDNLEIVFGFLNRLAKMALPEGVIASDTEGYIIEGAMQKGFDFIDDNAELLVVHANDLIKFVTEQRIPHWVSTRRRQPAAAEGFLVKGWNHTPGRVAAGAAGSISSCDWFIELPPFPKERP